MAMSNDVTSQGHDREYLCFALLLLMVLVSLAGH